MPYDVFISYASEDIAFAQELNDHLVNEGFKVWFDKTRLSPGFDWYKEIEQGCENSRVILPVMTPRWKNSEWTKFETYSAEAVFPILFEGIWSDVSTPPLERFQAEMMEMNRIGGPEWPRLISDIRRVRESQLPEKASHLTHIHYRANPYFTGRELDLIKVHEELHTKPITGLTTGRVRAITAMGGAGKTTLVREYVEKFWRCYSQMLWVDCRIGMEREFAHIHDILFPERKDIGLKDEDKANSALNELNSDVSRLLILDNADGLEEAVINWVPPTGACHTLITSRFSSFGAAIETIHLFLLDKSHSIDLLKKRTKRAVKDAELISCETLAEQLGYLPLALEQAAAFIFEQGEYFGFADYLLEYEKSKEELLEIKVLGSNMYPDSVITTWNSTISKLSPTGRSILHLSSYLAPIPIPVEHLVKVSAIICDHAEKFYDSISLKENIGKTLWLRNELAKLKAYSMIEYDGLSFSIHPLLQVVEQITDSPEQINLTWNQAAEMLIETAPPACWEADARRFWTLSNQKKWNNILLHIFNLEKIKLKHEVIIESSLFRYLQINAYASNHLFEKVLLPCQQLLEKIKYEGDSKGLSFLSILKTLAYLQKELGLNKEALLSFSLLFQSRAKLLGEEAQLTIYAHHVVAIMLKLNGQSEEAEKIMKKVLSIQQRTLGDENYDTIVSMHNIGWLLYDSEFRWQEAETYYRYAFEKWENSVGFEILDTRISAQNLAYLLARKGDLVQAEKVQRDLLAGTEAILGKDHIDCLGLKHNLSLLFIKGGKYAEALPIIEEVVEGYRKNLPPDHRDMLTALQDLGTILGSLKRFSEAESLLREALNGYEKTQGSDAEDTLRTVGNLANLLEEMGRSEEAKPLHLRVINNTLSKKDITPLEIRKGASDCFNLGDYELTETLLLRVLAEKYEIPGTNCHLSRIYILTNRLSDAQEHIEQAWQHLKEAPIYVAARILWFKITLAFITKSSNDNYFGQLKTVLQKENAFMSWTMQPVLDHIKPQLTGQQHALLSALVNAMSDKQNLEKLNNFQEWKDAKPEEIELNN
jgi:tetratricopeptide (TPR) repeat protein